MTHKILDLTTLSYTIYSKRIWESSLTYQVGYELVVPIEKVKELVTKQQGSKLYTVLKYSHVSINCELHPLERIEGQYIGRNNRLMVKLLFKCEYKVVTHNDGL